MSTVPIALEEFRTVYERRVADVVSRTSRDLQIEIARHCAGWHPDRFDFTNYLVRSTVRYHRAYSALARRGARTAVDVGGFWGVFPLVLKDLGFEVHMTETLGYYSKAFDPLFEFLRGAGVIIADYDPFEPSAASVGRFDGVFVMAVLEHYPHSLRACMQNLRSLMAEDAFLYLEVPNIAYWPKRWAFFRHGVTPLAAIEEIWESEVPFIGHHHEFTIHELRRLARLAGLVIEDEDFYNYSLDTLPMRELLRSPWLHVVPVLVKSAREVMAVVCRDESSA